MWADVTASFQRGHCACRRAPWQERTRGLSPVLRVNSSDGPADAVGLDTTWWEGHFISTVFLPKTHNLGLIMRTTWDKPQFVDILSNRLPNSSKLSKKKSMRSPQPSGTKGTWQLNAMRSWTGAGHGKKDMGANSGEPSKVRTVGDNNVSHWFVNCNKCTPTLM